MAWRWEKLVARLRDGLDVSFICTANRGASSCTLDEKAKIRVFGIAEVRSDALAMKCL